MLMDGRRLWMKPGETDAEINLAQKSFSFSGIQMNVLRMAKILKF